MPFQFSRGYAAAVPVKRFFKNHLPGAWDGLRFALPLRTGAPFFLFEKRFYGLANQLCARRPVFFRERSFAVFDSIPKAVFPRFRDSLPWCSLPRSGLRLPAVNSSSSTQKNGRQNFPSGKNPNAGRQCDIGSVRHSRRPLPFTQHNQDHPHRRTDQRTGHQ